MIAPTKEKTKATTMKGIAVLRMAACVQCCFATWPNRQFHGVLVIPNLNRHNPSTMKERITDYAILHAETADELVIKVAGLLSQEFQPLGNPFVDQRGVVYQAMVKHGASQMD